MLGLGAGSWRKREVDGNGGKRTLKRGRREFKPPDVNLQKKVKSENKGLISEDRSNTATLPLTIPRSLFKSSAKDLALAMFLVWLTGKLQARLPFAVTAELWRRRYRGTSTGVRQKLPENISLRSSTDSDLEAFSHNPTDGSFAPLPAQASANTKCPNQRFLSYWVELLLQQHFNSRVKLTCLTTV